MSYIDRTSHIHKFGGEIWYVNASMASSGAGTRPDIAFKTITEAVTASATGDMISVKAGTYVEDVVLGAAGSKDSLELRCEIGTILDGTGTCLTVAGNYSKVTCPGGAIKVTPADTQTGVLVTGVFCYLEEIRVSCNDLGDCGFDIVGGGADLRRCRVSSVQAVGEAAAFIITGDKIKLEDCCTGGNAATTGFKVEATADKARIKSCGSQGHTVCGFCVDTGATNGVVEDCYSGGLDGAPVGTSLEGWAWDLSVDEEVFHSTDISASTASGYDNLFKVTGSVNIVFIYGDVHEAIDATVNDIKLALYDGASTNITNDVNTASAPVKSLFIKTKLAANAMELMKSDAASINESSSQNKGALPFVITAKNGTDTFIRAVWDGADSVGEIHWHCHWERITEDGFVEGV